MKGSMCGIGLVFAVALATGIGIQAAQDPQTSSAQTSRASNAAMKVTGCIERDSGSASSTGATGSSASSSSAAGAASYKLTHLDTSDKSSTGASGATGAAGSTSAMGSSSAQALQGATEVKLEPESSKVNLSEHVNHKVELTGKLMSGMGAASSTGAGSTGAGSTGSTGSSATGMSARSMPTFEVSNIRMISSTCSNQ